MSKLYYWVIQLWNGWFDFGPLNIYFILDCHISIYQNIIQKLYCCLPFRIERNCLNTQKKESIMFKSLVLILSRVRYARVLGKIKRGLVMGTVYLIDIHIRVDLF